MEASNNKIKVVVVGGGVGGSNVASALDKNARFHVTLINKTDKFYHMIGLPRALVDTNFATNIFISYEKLLKNGRFIQGEVQEISSSSVTLKDSSDVINYDYLVIATGSTWNAPVQFLRSNSSIEQVTDLADRIRRADRILIVGAGAVGVEISGEIATDYPLKKVTLVSSSQHLVSEHFTSKVQTSFTNQLEKMKVDVIRGDKVILPEDFDASAIPNVESKTYTTEKGKSIEADLVLVCTGGKPNFAPLQTNFARQLDENNRLKVNLHLQVEEHNNIFALGDIINTPETKTAFNTGNQAKIVVKNIISSADKKPLSSYKLGKFMMLVTLGRRGGAGNLFGLNVGTTIVPMIKGKDFFVGRTAKQFNHSVKK